MILVGAWRKKCLGSQPYENSEIPFRGVHRLFLLVRLDHNLRQSAILSLRLHPPHYQKKEKKEKKKKKKKKKNCFSFLTVKTHLDLYKLARSVNVSQGARLCG